MINSLLVEAAKQVLEKSQRDENFKKWFGKSILKHDDGTPMHFYHGTGADIHKYDYAHVGKGNDSYGSGFYFTNKPEVAGMYAGDKESPNIQKVHLRLEKPIHPEDEKPFRREHIQRLIQAAPDHKESLMNYGDVNHYGYNRVLRDAVDAFADLPKFHAMNALGNDFYSGHEGELLKNIKGVTGHDGVIVKHPNEDGSTHIVANIFHPNQIKSAIGNIGTYSRRKDSLTESTTEEEWLHVENRQSKLPHDHVGDVIDEHKKLGYSITEDEEDRARRTKAQTNDDGQAHRSFIMESPEKRMVVLMKFRKGPNQKHTDYKIKRRFTDLTST